MESRGRRTYRSAEYTEAEYISQLHQSTGRPQDPAGAHKKRTVSEQIKHRLTLASAESVLVALKRGRVSVPDQYPWID